MHLPAFVIAILCAVFMSSLPAIAQDRSPDQPLLRISKDADGLGIVGSASSDAHETILRETTRATVGETVADSLSVDMSVGALTPPGWSLVTEMVLRAVLTTQYATAEVTPATIVIKGIGADADRWQTAIQRVDAAKLDGMRLEHEVVSVDSRASYQTLCRRQFLTLARDNKIQFFNSGAAINTDAYRALDALIELAVQCPSLVIEVVGHTDSSGEEAANLAISEARAAAVVDYMVSRGLPTRRLSGTGAGSSRPLVAESNRNSRRLNRRVEFRLAEPG